MSKIYVSNAFSIQMLADSASMTFEILSIREAVDFLFQNAADVVSAVGHADTAALISGILGISIPMNRMSVTLQASDILIVGQYTGPRLPEGSHTLPAGAALTFWKVSRIT